MSGALTKGYWGVRLAALRALRRMIGLHRARVHFVWRVRQFDARGRLIGKSTGPNITHDEGEQFMAQVLFSQEASVPDNYYIGMDKRGTLTEGDTLADLVDEPEGSGYARQPVPSESGSWAIEDSTYIWGGWKAKSKEVTFTASGGTIPSCLHLFLCTVASGTSGVLLSSYTYPTNPIEPGGSYEATVEMLLR